MADRDSHVAPVDVFGREHRHDIFEAKEGRPSVGEALRERVEPRLDAARDGTVSEDWWAFGVEDEQEAAWAQEAEGGSEQA